ncbi:P-loop NTPase [Candidatus Woesearchaeota archaeon]|nr:P-loop NTPase [Candidatus Woesearchaeota archaeon]
MKKITVLSGKGGVGKSTLTASLAVLLAENKRKIVAADCDVDAPNLALVLGLRQEGSDSWKNVQTGEKAELIPEKCTRCRKCYENCYFSAISWEKGPVFDPLRCVGCGVCELVCPAGAVLMRQASNAKVGMGKTKYGFSLISGQLDIGESGSGKVVTYIKNKAEDFAEAQGADIILADSAAGIGCPVIASITGSDYIIAVTEPTPSALSDLKRALQVVSHFSIPAGIVINKHDINPGLTAEIERFARKKGMDILGKLPFDRKFVEAVVSMVPVVEYDKKFLKIFSEILHNLETCSALR